jgi:hypothetical protein
MTDLKLGNLIDSTQGRDAVHIAIAPVVAGERLSPGQHIGFLGEVVGRTKNTIGIVDPFLEGPVFKGERFWMFLYPNTITTLRHEWEHPAFSKDGAGGSGSEVWLRDFAADAGLSYEELINAAKRYLEYDDYLCQGGRWDGFDTPDEFWDHYETVVGTKVPLEKRGSFFSCSC